MTQKLFCIIFITVNIKEQLFDVSWIRRWLTEPSCWAPRKELKRCRLKWRLLRSAAPGGAGVIETKGSPSVWGPGGISQQTSSAPLQRQKLHVRLFTDLYPPQSQSSRDAAELHHYRRKVKKTDSSNKLVTAPVCVPWGGVLNGLLSRDFCLFDFSSVCVHSAQQYWWLRKNLLAQIIKNHMVFLTKAAPHRP